MMRQIIIGILIGLLTAGPLGCSSGPIITDSSVKPLPLSRPVIKVVTKAEYRIQPNDTLIITVWEHPEMGRERVVSPEGLLRFPLLGDLSVKNLSLGELEKTLSDAMAPYLKNPIISVEAKSAPPTKVITVLGAIAKPGDYEFRESDEVRLMSVLGRAGGYTTTTDLEQVYLLRTNPDKPLEWEKFQIDLKGSLADPAGQDVALQNYDVVILEHTGTNKWNTTLSEMTPTLTLIALVLGIFYAGDRLRD